MRIISRKILQEFWIKHSVAEKPLRYWFAIVSHAIWQNTADVKKTFRTVDQPVINGKRIAIFNIGGNKFRIVTTIHFNTQKLFIRNVLTHIEYDTEKWKETL